MAKEKKSGKGSKVVLIIVGIVLAFVLISGAVFLGYYFATKNKPVSDSGNNAQEVKGIKTEATLPLDEFLVNLADEGKARYLQVVIHLAYDSENKDMADTLKAKVPAIKDAINNVLRTKKATDITPQGEAALKQEIMDRVNDILDVGKIYNVYFSKLIVQ